MRILRVTLLGLSLAVCASLRAVYAPIPEQEQGKDLTLTLLSGVSYNNNIFGSASNAIGSTVFVVSPGVTSNSSLTDQTFLSLVFNPKLEYFDNRPGSKALYSQNASALIAHAFSRTSVLTLSDAYSYNQDPESLLNGEPVNTNQTLQSNQFDARYTVSPTEKLGLVVKARSVYFDYVDQLLGSELNRFENLYGLEFDYTLLPNLKAAGEYRHQDVDYSNDPSENNKHTDFLMAGFDYNLGPKLSASTRLGAEDRTREGSSSQSSPYAEFSFKYAYAKASFVSVGYTYSLEESSDPVHFTDEKVNRIFTNLQYALTPNVIGSASVDYEPSTLLGRNGQSDESEDSTHAGLALT
jgi:hypothetical protein